MEQPFKKSRLEPAALIVLSALLVWLYSASVGKVEMIEGAKAWLALHDLHITSPAPETTGDAASSLGKNPFVNGVTKSFLRYHPWLTSVIPEGNLPIPVDYFGYRNRKDRYFQEPDPRCRTVVVTGNSEAVGSLVLKAIPEALEARLEQIVPGCWRVVNLAMSGLTTSQERNNFITLGYDLKPDFVISHSGPIDIFNMLPLNAAVQVEAPFVKLSMIYDANAAIAVGKIFGSPLSLKGTSAVEEDAGAALLKSILLYKRAAETRNAHFIWGIQKFGISALGIKLKVDRLYFAGARTLGKISRWLRENEGTVDVIDFNTGVYPYTVPDGIHSTPEGVEVIAKAYAAHIARILSQRGSGEDRAPAGPDSAEALQRYLQFSAGGDEGQPAVCEGCLLFTRWGEKYGTPVTSPAGKFRAKRRGRVIRIRAELDAGAGPYNKLLIFSGSDLLRAADIGENERKVRVNISGGADEKLRVVGLSTVDGRYALLEAE